MLKCNNCGEVMQEPETLYKGLDCPSVGSTEKLQTIDWYDYELTNDGINAVLNGYLPQTTLGKAITKHVKTSTFSDFSAITTHGLKVSKRYDRKNTVVKVGIKNKKELLEKNGMSAFSSLVQGVVSSLAEILRETDIVSSKEEDIFIFMPETPKENIKAAFDRVNSNISQNISDNIILETQTASNEEELEKIL
jgi:hypothetical protein